ncbi:L-ascorbate oxidase-like isoform B [Glycine soja]|uniref:L-ascorbate oxidase-like isoform B n=1 Tax=Glycine soja TaxID=3848 RepID=A0A445K3F3_GLYSO|nr:L-ascorbate oxidase-like isoform B [Glycine soja]
MPLKLAGVATVGSLLLCVAISLFHIAGAEDPYRFFNWNITYGDIYPLGVRQTGILINGQFPGPDIHSVTNDNLIINVFNSLDEPFLLSWNGIQQRRNSFEDGVFGTTCPIPAGKNFTYILQVKDQIGTFYYFPSLAFHKAAGGFGGIRILSRPRIPVPFPDPAGDYTVLIGDWYKSNHTTLKARLDRGKKLPFPDGILINGRGPNGVSFNVEQGKTYRLRISNVGLQHSLNFRIQNHKMKLVEVEGTHTLQTMYSSLDVHVGQSYSVLVTADQPAQDYYIVVSTRFSYKVLTTTGVLRYSNSAGPVSGPPPGGPTIQIDWSLNQARSIRTNLTASGPRPNPQGSYHYGMINTTKTIILTPLLSSPITSKSPVFSAPEAYLTDPLAAAFTLTHLCYKLTTEILSRLSSKTTRTSFRATILMATLSLSLVWMGDNGQLLAGTSTISEMQLHVAPHRYTPFHGLLFILPLTMWECGT